LAGGHRNIIQVRGVQGTPAELVTLSMEATTPPHGMRDMKSIYPSRDSGSAKSVNHYSGVVECNVGVRETVDITWEEES